MFPYTPGKDHRYSGNGDIAELVRAYQRTHQSPILDKIIMMGWSHIRSIVRVATRSEGIPMVSPVADFEDYFNAAITEFIKILDRYDSAQGPLMKYASARIYGAVVDEFRSLSSGSRESRKILRAFSTETAKSMNEGNQNYPLIAERIGVSHTNLLKAVALGQPPIYLDDLAHTHERADTGPSQFDMLVDKECRERIRQARSVLSSREKGIIDAVFFNGLTNQMVADSGIAGDISESRVGQLRHHALEQMKPHLEALRY